MTNLVRILAALAATTALLAVAPAADARPIVCRTKLCATQGQPPPITDPAPSWWMPAGCWCGGWVRGR